jgi:hypothetical protein
MIGFLPEEQITIHIIPIILYHKAKGFAIGGK